MLYEDSSFQEIAVLTENESMLFLESPNRVQPPYASVCFVEQNQCGRPVTFAERGIDTPAHLCLSCRLIPCHLHRDQKGNQAGFSVDEMLTLLLNGMTVDQLLAIIQKRIAAIVSEATARVDVTASDTLGGSSRRESPESGLFPGKGRRAHSAESVIG